MSKEPSTRAYWTFAALAVVVAAGSIGCELKKPGEVKPVLPEQVERPGMEGSGKASCSLCDLYDKVAGSVVAVYGVGLKPPDSAPEFEEFVRRQFDPRTEVGLGSGVVVDQKGLVLTAAHVVEGAGALVVKLADGRKVAAVRVGKDPDLDVALLRLEEAGIYEAAVLGDSDGLRVGQAVAAVGNPVGLDHSFTVGVVSGLNRRSDDVGDPALKPGIGYIQTDAALSRGSSGSPLFDMSGRVVGMSCMVHADASGIGFAVPVNLVKNLLPKLEKGWMGRPWLGVDVVRSQEKEQLGVVVKGVAPGGPADEAGIKPGDVILEFAGYAIADISRLKEVLEQVKVGEPVNIMLKRGEEELELEVTPIPKQ